MIQPKNTSEPTYSWCHKLIVTSCPVSPTILVFSCSYLVAACSAVKKGGGFRGALLCDGVIGLVSLQVIQMGFVYMSEDMHDPY